VSGESKKKITDNDILEIIFSDQLWLLEYKNANQDGKISCQV